MPLAHQSLSHGVVAFGFFHIETDLLVLERLFFFAGDFCAWLRDLAQAAGDRDFTGELPGWVIEDPAAMGDLHGAIGGVRLHGFLGALYQRQPFPQQDREFRQKPAGAFSREQVAELIAPFGRSQAVPLMARAEQRVVEIGTYAFDRHQFLALVDYVWRGGMPGWQDGRRPAYLDQTAGVLTSSGSDWFRGLDLDPALVGVRPMGY